MRTVIAWRLPTCSPTPGEKRRESEKPASGSWQEAQDVWPAVAKILYVPHTTAEYEPVVEILDQLIDQVGEDETHPLASLMEVRCSYMRVTPACISGVAIAVNGASSAFHSAWNARA